MPTPPVRDHDRAPADDAAAGPEAALRIAMLCLHTSPLRQPGQGDAGGMNVHVRQLAAHLARQGLAVDLVTLWRDAEHRGEPRPEAAVTVQDVDGQPGLRLVTVTLPGAAAASKDELPRHLPGIVQALRDAGADLLPRPHVLHGHYWLSGEVGRELARLWDLPLVLSLHTSARGKNVLAAPGEALEPEIRERAEQRLIDEAAVLVVNTAAEGEQMRQLYGADPARLRVIAPGVDLDVFRPGAGAGGDGDEAGDGRAAATAAPVIGFAGRLQPLKGPQILLDALGLLAEPSHEAQSPGGAHRPHRARPSGRGQRPQDPGSAPAQPGPLRPRLRIAGVGDAAFSAALHDRARRLGIEHQVDWLGSLPVHDLAQRMCEADVWAVPSSSETFGLVALEAQACGTPVLASRVGGLPAAVEDGRTGWLVHPRTPQAWARALRDVLTDPAELARRGEAAADRARGFSWSATARAHADDVYAPLRSRGR